jgi:hypothetical protein
MIGALRPIVGGGARETYTSTMTGLWNGLGDTLRRLDEIAADPDETLAQDDVVESLGSLQYSLHTAEEVAAGLTPPSGAEDVHEELAAALGEARDTTAEVAFAVELGGAEAAEPYVWEWRGALFRVRLARLRLAPPTEAAAETPAPVDAIERAVASRVLLLGGAVALVGGVLLGLWLVAALGLTVFAAGAVSYRP